MRILIEYSGKDVQEIKLNVLPNVPKSTYYRIVDYGIKIFSKYVSTHTFVKTRHSIIVTRTLNQEKLIEPTPIKIVKPTVKKEKLKSIDNTAMIESIIDHLNQCTGKSYKPNSKIAISNINARLKEGYEFDDFVKVIEVKSAKWLGDTKMEDFLTPNTLFGNKFESYLNENIVLPKTKQDNNYEQVRKATELGFNN
jgi:uncharacterized phage protein (TIGR02220 family)